MRKHVLRCIKVPYMYLHTSGTVHTIALICHFYTAQNRISHNAKVALCEILFCAVSKKYHSFEENLIQNVQIKIKSPGSYRTDLTNKAKFPMMKHIFVCL